MIKPFVQALIFMPLYITSSSVNIKPLYGLIDKTSTVIGF